MVAWPGSLPQSPLVDSLREQPENNIKPFFPSKGRPITTLWATSSGKVLQFQMLFTPAHRTTFETFFYTTLGGGILEFDAPDPWNVDGTIAVIFHPENPFQYGQRSRNNTLTDLRWYRLPT